MKSERFLWPMTFKHCHGLTAARNIEGRLSADPNGKDVARLAEEVKTFVENYLSLRFTVEKKVLVLFARHAGFEDADLLRVVRAQGQLMALGAKGTAESLGLFAKKLRSFIFYEADWFLNRVEATLTMEEKQEALDRVKNFNPDLPELPAAVNSMRAAQCSSCGRFMESENTSHHFIHGMN